MMIELFFIPSTSLIYPLACYFSKLERLGPSNIDPIHFVDLLFLSNCTDVPLTHLHS